MELHVANAAHNVLCTCASTALCTCASTAFPWGRKAHVRVFVYPNTTLSSPLMRVFSNSAPCGHNIMFPVDRKLTQHDQSVNKLQEMPFYPPWERAGGTKSSDQSPKAHEGTFQKACCIAPDRWTQKNGKGRDKGRCPTGSPGVELKISAVGRNYNFRCYRYVNIHPGHY